MAPAGINAEQPQPQAGWEDSAASIGLIDGSFDTKIAPPPAAVETAPPAPVRVAPGFARRKSFAR